jgi:hypothetical protein
MDFYELLAKEMGTPVLCIDGFVGMLVRYPKDESHDSCAGVEIPGEPECRWIAWHDLIAAGEALRQKGSPPVPQSNWHHCPQEQTAMARRLLSELWVAKRPSDATDPAGGAADMRGPSPVKR